MRRSLLAGFALAALTIAAPAVAQSATATAWSPMSFDWNATTKTFKYRVVAGMSAAKSPFNFNGKTDGELAMVVPIGTTLVIDFVNEDGVPHSAEVILDKDPMPTEGGAPAIQRAYTIKALEGMAQGEKDVMRFKAVEAGRYRLFCAVPGHGLSGMWIGLVVDADASITPRIDTTVTQAHR